MISKSNSLAVKFSVKSRHACIGLEMKSPKTIPEQGITDNEVDHTRGPACSLACSAAKMYRNNII